MLAVLLLALPALPVQDAHTLSGWLVDPDGAPIENAVLILEPLDGQPALRLAVDTNAYGMWRCEGIAPGRWRPRLRHFGPSLGDVRFEPAELVVPSPPLGLKAHVARVSIDAGEGAAFCVQVPDRLRTLECGEHLPDPLEARTWLVRLDARLVVGTWSTTLGLAEIEHVFESDAPWSTPLRPVRPALAAAPGYVEVFVPRPTDGLGVKLCVLAPRSRYELLKMSPTLGPEGSGTLAFRFTLPPGDYLLALGEHEPPLVCPMPGDTTWERHAHRTIETPMRVGAATRQSLELAWEAGVRPTLRFDAPGAASVFVWELDAAGRITRPVGCEPFARGLVLGDLLAWPDGPAHPTREPLPVGRVRLLAGADGFAPREFELELVDGVPCEARIELSALER